MPDLLGIVRCQDGLEQGVALLGLAFFAVADIAADQDDYGDHTTGYHHGHTAHMHQTHHHAGADKGHAGRNEPAADYRDHTRYAEHSAFASPGLVGQRCTHGHHKGDEGGR